jgi:RimJ/RimL family protein N-acetyltransferase
MARFDSDTALWIMGVKARVNEQGELTDEVLKEQFMSFVEAFKKMVINNTTITETSRLRLTQFTEEDAPFVLQILNTPGWLQFIGDRNVKTLEIAKDYTKEKLIAAYTKFGFGMYAMRLKDTGEIIGMCGLVKRDNLDHADIGYALLPEFSGKGYAREAASAVLKHANEVLKLNPILAIVTPGNNSSIKLLENLQFSLQGNVVHNGTELLLFQQTFPL